MKSVTWQQIKSFFDSRGIDPQFVEFDSEYYIVALDGELKLFCTLSKDATDTTDLDDFEANYKPNGNKKIFPSPAAGVKDPKYMRARLVGSHYGTIPAAQTKDIDWQIPNLSWSGSNKQTYFDGVEYYAQSAELGDKVSFSVVDVDGISYPAGTVLEEFAKNMYIIPNQKDTLRLYKARLIVGMYIRITYESTGSSDVKLICNLMRHLDSSKDV